MSIIPGHLTTTITSTAPVDSGDTQSIQRSAEYQALTHELHELQRSNIDLARRYHWAMQLTAVVGSQPRSRWLRWLPLWFWRRRQFRRLQQKALFDAAQYLSRYPDVARRRRDPLVHFLARGLAEGRSGIPAFAVPPPPSPELIRRILVSGLFDHGWYCAEYGQSEPVEAALKSYLLQSFADPLHNPGPLFSGACYLLQNPDYIGLEPLTHFIEIGMTKGRGGLSPARADRFMVSAADTIISPLSAFIDPRKPTIVLCWAEGNFFFTDIARYVQEYLQHRGLKSVVETTDASYSSDEYNFVVVAPHEYCVHGPGAEWDADRLACAVYVNTEQWHTSWFSLAFGIMQTSRKALDINPASARGLTKLGIDTGFLPLLPVAGGIFSFPVGDVSQKTSARRVIEALPHGSDFADRPYDILFVGALNDRRGKILANLAVHLAQHNCFIHSPQLRGPVNDKNPNMISSVDVAQLARNSKILLNIHQGDSQYLEWHRLFLSGICEGCVVVTEPCVDTGILVAGRHYLEAQADAMGDLMDRLLTPEGAIMLADIRDNCRTLLANLQFDQQSFL